MKLVYIYLQQCQMRSRQNHLNEDWVYKLGHHDYHSRYDIRAQGFASLLRIN